jgi:hypothetical protein
VNPSFWKLKAVLLTLSPMLAFVAGSDVPSPIVRFIAGTISAGSSSLLGYLLKSPESQREQNETEDRTNR